MKLYCNRFALVPHMCCECKKYIWLEPYRRSDVIRYFIGVYERENICKACLPKLLETEE